MKRETVVVLSDLPWDYPADYTKQICLKLCRRAKVVVLTPTCLLSWRQLLSARARQFTPKEKVISYFRSISVLPLQRFWLVRKTNLFLNFFLFYVWYIFHFGPRRPIFWVFSYSQAEILPFLVWRKKIIYERVDHPASAVYRENLEIRKQDKEILRKADLVFSNSPYALGYIRRYHQKALLMPWGGSFPAGKEIIPDKLKTIKAPRLGFIGHLDHRLNLKLLYELARERPGWNFIFIGPIFEFDRAQGDKLHFAADLNKLRRLPNFFYLGSVNKKEIPGFIAGFDICLIPYDSNQEFVKGSNPMKTYEYLSLGKPVVSAPIEALKTYEPVLKIADGTEGFIEAIEKILKNVHNRKEFLRRKEIARANTWERNVDFIWQKITLDL